MNVIVHKVKSRLKGTWVHHAVWAYRNPPIKVPIQADREQIALKYQNAIYDWQTIKVMFRVLHRNSNCIDVGAHGGAFLKHMLAIAPQGRHYAFEPLPHMSRRLREVFPQAIVYQVAVSDKTGKSDFQFVENDPGYSGLRQREYDRPDPKITTLRVREVTLDEIIPSTEKIAFIRIDIEDGEFHAIKRGIDTIRRGSPAIVFEASSRSTGLYGVTPDDLYLLVTRTLGYELSTMDRWLKRKQPYTRDEFAKNWHEGSDYYFIASPRRFAPRPLIIRRSVHP
jgi:FkbM family methyltransferase